MAKASKITVNVQTGTQNTVFATWTWTKKNTDCYSIVWYYATGDGVWFIGNDTTVDAKQSVYSAPSNAIKVKFKVKPIAKKHTVNDKQVAYWTADWSTAVTYNFKNNAPLTPSVPSVIVEKYKLTSEVDVYDSLAEKIEFQIVKNDKSIFKTGKATITKNHASFSCTITAGNEYKVRCRAVRKKEYSDWSEYSQNAESIPSVPTEITSCKAISSTSVKLEWSKVSNATSYDIEYTTKKRYFDSSNETSSMSVASVVKHAEITGLDSGEEWFFRVRAVNEQGVSGWCPIVSTVLGKVPAAPTTWSSTTTAVVGENVILYWVHNSEDGSSQKYAEIELVVNGAKKVITKKNSTDEDKKDKTSAYTIKTSSYTEGAVIQWRVRTKGIIDEYGDWSIQRTIDIYAPPTLEFGISNTNKWYWNPFNFETDIIYTAYGEIGELTDRITSFPFYISATAGPDTQSAIGFYLTISANEGYQMIDNTGKTVWVNDGEIVYSQYFDASDNHFFMALMPTDLHLENDITYTVHCSVSMNSGLTAEANAEFVVAWQDDIYEPDAEIGVDEETLVAYIRPYCELDGEMVDNVILSVYRREFDGSFTELATGLHSSTNTTITDPHPALDYARYRIVAMSVSTGTISYYDIPGYPVGEIGVIIQWDEEWTNFDNPNEAELKESTWSGSMLRLPYNIDVSDSSKPDVTLMEYIGREHPVSYYGTQLGKTSTWSVEIPREDEETLYALRRLARWMGDVYVREPSGSGYWASITVSYSINHCKLTIPVTFNITRVEGDI